MPPPRGVGVGEDGVKSDYNFYELMDSLTTPQSIQTKEQIQRRLGQ